MNIKPITNYIPDDRPLLFKHKVYYEPNCFLEENIKRFKGKNFLIRNDYVNNKLISTLIYMTKAGKWVKSKLKIFREGKLAKVVRSQNGDRMV